MPNMECNGVTLAYRWEGRATGPVLVLSHSLGAAGVMWQDQVNDLGSRFRLLIPDHRGHGRSSVPDGPYQIDQFGRELIALLDRLQLDRVHFCGLSLGGMIGMWLGQHAPERIDRLVLCNTAAKIADATLLRDRSQQVERDGITSIAESVIDRWFTAFFRTAQPDIADRARNMLLASSARGYMHTCQAVCSLDLRSGLPSIACPTLVIAGQHDLATPVSWSEEIAAAVPNSHLAVLPAAHLSNIEARENFNDEVASFLTADRSA